MFLQEEIKTCTQREDYVKTHGEDGQLQAKEKGQEKILPPWTSEETNPMDILILNV